MLGRLAGASAARAAGARHAHVAQNTARRAAGSRPAGELALVMTALVFKRRPRSDSRRAGPFVTRPKDGIRVCARWGREYVSRRRPPASRGLNELVRASLPRPLLQVPTPNVLV